jgi:hypothetical protein
VAFKSLGEPRYLAQAITVLTLAARRPPRRYPGVAAPYVAPEGQRLCREAAVGYLDLTGNAFLRLDGVLVDRRTEARPPRTRARLRRLVAPRSPRVLRVLLEQPKASWTLTRLAEEATVSLRTAHLVVNHPPGLLESSRHGGRSRAGRRPPGRDLPAGVELARRSHPEPRHWQVAMAGPESLIEGRWRIVETELWDQEALDLVVPAYLRFDRQGLGEMQLIAIGASIDYRVEQRDGASVVESPWAGFDEMDAISGRVWARIDGDMMCGTLFIHQGDESTFVARRERAIQRVSAPKVPRPADGARARVWRGRRGKRGSR